MYLWDKKKSDEMMESLDHKTTKIYEAIQDAEQIVLEMNNFSDYLLSRIDAKVQEFEDKIPKEENIFFEELKGTDLKKSEVPLKDQINQIENIGKNIDVKLQGEKIDLKGLYGLEKEKPIPLNPKHKEIYLLKESGLEELEIAKVLELGIGEVRLILGLKN
jgi:flagellar motor switch/type III secretory pathway protein FliN